MDVSSKYNRELNVQIAYLPEFSTMRRSCSVNVICTIASKGTQQSSSSLKIPCRTCVSVDVDSIVTCTRHMCMSVQLMSNTNFDVHWNKTVVLCLATRMLLRAKWDLFSSIDL